MGAIRHLTVKLNRSDVKMDYRPGYYAPADFQHAKTEDREMQLTEQMRSDLPATDVAVYLQALYFRLEDNKFFVPVSLMVPGSQIPFVKNGDKDKANIDITGRGEECPGDHRRECSRHGEAGAGCGAAGAAEEHSVFDWIYAGAGAVSPEVCGAGEPDGSDGELRDGPAGSGHEEGSAEDEFDCAVEPADAEYGEEGGESAGAGWGGVDSECAACLPAGPASLLPV